MSAFPPCRVCRNPATLECSRCRLVFYCREEHRIKHSRRHKAQCRTCKIDFSPEHGCCLKAARDIKQGEVIFVEAPFIFGPNCFSQSPCCVGCYCDLPSDLAMLSSCPKCQWAICSPNCPRLSDPAGHAVECALLKVVADKSCPRKLVLPYRCMFLQRSNPALWTWLKNHYSNAVAKQADSSKHHQAASVLEEIANIFFQQNPGVLPLDYCEETFKKIFAVLDAYGLQFHTSNLNRKLTGLYETAGFLQRSCVANTRIDFIDFSEVFSAKGFGRVTVSALKDISTGEILSRSSASSMFTTYLRQTELARQNVFCRCPRCLDPREMGLDVGTMKCTSCPGWILPLDTLSIGKCNWACDRNCGVTRTAAEVSGRLSYLAKRCHDIRSSGLNSSKELETLEAMLAEFLAELHPNHELCFLLKSIMLKVYRSHTNDHLERRTVLCHEMLDAINRFGPNIYHAEQTVVFTLREFVEVQFELTRAKFPSPDWTTDRATSNVAQCLNLLERALETLPKNKPNFEVKSCMRDTYRNILRWATVNDLEIPKNANEAMFL